jgi:hypothetical protein
MRHLNNFKSFSLNESVEELTSKDLFDFLKAKDTKNITIENMIHIISDLVNFQQTDKFKLSKITTDFLNQKNNNEKIKNLSLEDVKSIITKLNQNDFKTGMKDFADNYNASQFKLSSILFDTPKIKIL